MQILELSSLDGAIKRRNVTYEYLIHFTTVDGDQNLRITLPVYIKITRCYIRSAILSTRRRINIAAIHTYIYKKKRDRAMYKERRCRFWNAKSSYIRSRKNRRHWWRNKYLIGKYVEIKALSLISETGSIVSRRSFVCRTKVRAVQPKSRICWF